MFRPRFAIVKWNVSLSKLRSRFSDPYFRENTSSKWSENDWWIFHEEYSVG